MEIQARNSRDAQQIARQDLPIRDDTMTSGTLIPQLLDRCGLADSLWLEYRHVMLHRERLDWGRHQFESPSRRLVRLRYAREYMVLRRCAAASAASGRTISPGQ
jgi:hypothetical protein